MKVSISANFVFTTFFLTCRYGDTERDMMGALLLLVSEKASEYICGVTIPVDGGISLYTVSITNPTGIFEE